MNNESRYPKRLIEVDLPIKRISAHARREKSIRHGHISTLHIWWARRPLAACRAVICAALWPDPVDELCPPAFRTAAAHILAAFAENVRQDTEFSGFAQRDGALARLCRSSLERWQRTNMQTLRADDPAAWPEMRYALLDFIADFANWDASTVPAFLETSRALTQAAHEALGGIPGTRPLVVDPFAGGGAIPLEALRVGADAFASDLNPVAVLLNKVVLEYIPRYGQRLADEVRTWGQWVKAQAEQELAEFYPKDPDGATPIAYLWARTVICEGPGCGAEVPLIRSLWLAKKGDRSVALRIVPNPAENRVDFAIIQGAKAKDVGMGTVARGSATCPCCGFTTPVTSVRKQLKPRRGGANDARLFCVVMTHPGEQGRHYRLPTERDLAAVRAAAAELERRKAAHTGELSLVPDEEISMNEIRRISVPLYGMATWGDIFSPREALVIVTLEDQLKYLEKELIPYDHTEHFIDAIKCCLLMTVDKQADYLSSLCTWHYHNREKINHTFGRQAIPFVSDFVETVFCGSGSGNWDGLLDWTIKALEEAAIQPIEGQVIQTTATNHPLPTDSVAALITDPPYYDSVPYAYLSDFFYVWLRRALLNTHPDLFQSAQVPKDKEIVVDRPHELSNSTKDIAFYERELTKAFAEGRRITQPGGIGTIVFASKTTASWEAILQAVIEAGWIITGSWPIDTEMETRVAAQGQARLGSSIHLVCRPREDADGHLTENVGDWRDVLQALPRRIYEWLPRLAAEGVVGADAIFACLGPALEIFSRYSRVEKASGEVVPLREYLEAVWAAVSREALSVLFADADASGLEPDARLTAMWLWTLSKDEGGGVKDDESDDEGEEDEEVGGKGGGTATGGFSLEYDAARKIAQGLGARLEILSHVVEIKGGLARLLGVGERTRYLFGKEVVDAAPVAKKPKRAAAQLNLFAELEQAEEERGVVGELGAPPPGVTMLDRVHQAMILFATGRAEAMKRFLVEDGAGSDGRFWKLAQTLSALYPAGSDEKRWVDGVLARKKGLGF